MSTYLSSSLEGVSGQPGDDLQRLSHLSGARPDHFQNIAQPMQQTSHQVALGERQGERQPGERQGREVERVRSGTESRRETGGRGGEGQVQRAGERQGGEVERVRYREQEREAEPEQHLWP